MATIEYDNLFNEAYPKTKQYLTLLSGQSIVRGEVIGKNSSNKLVSYTDADKATIPFFGIAPADVDATGGDVEGVECITGCEVNSSALIFSASGDAVDQTFIDSCRLKGVHLVPFISGAVGTV